MKDALFWNKTADKYAKDVIADQHAYEETLERMKGVLKPHHRVLEIGCGTGSTALQLCESVETYLATDFSTRMIEIAREKKHNGERNGLRFAVQNKPIAELGSFDVIIALNMLHLVRDLASLVNQAYDALPSGGMLISKTGLLGEGLWILPWIIPAMRLVGKAPFVRSLKKDELISLLEKSGFEVRDTLMQPGMVPRLYCVATKP